MKKRPEPEPIPDFMRPDGRRGTEHITIDDVDLEALVDVGWEEALASLRPGQVAGAVEANRTRRGTTASLANDFDKFRDKVRRHQPDVTDTDLVPAFLLTLSAEVRAFLPDSPKAFLRRMRRGRAYRQKT